MTGAAGDEYGRRRREGGGGDGVGHAVRQHDEGARRPARSPDSRSAANDTGRSRSRRGVRGDQREAAVRGAARPAPRGDGIGEWREVDHSASGRPPPLLRWGSDDADDRDADPRLAALVAECESASELLRVHDRHRGAFAPCHVAALWKTWGALAARRGGAGALPPGPDPTAAVREATARAAGGPGADGHVVAAAMRGIADVAAGRVRAFNEQDIATTAWAYAAAGGVGEAAALVAEFKAQGLANIAWAYATAEHAAP
eukprot:gene22722-36526_t